MKIIATQYSLGTSTNGPPPQTIQLDASGNLVIESSSHTALQTNSLPLIPRLKSGIASAFLPAGYPSSVTADYLSFQIWDTIQALSSYVRGMLSTQAMLTGIGVGSATATPAAALLQFFYRDALGLITGVVFTAIQGSSFDAYPKQFRLAADVANDAGLIAELAAPIFPSAFLALACFGSICRSITGVAGGATRMALTQHFALQGNAADIAAKEGSQETAVTLVGMVLGLGLTRLADASVIAAWIAFLALTVLHVYANIRAMRCLFINRLNGTSLNIIYKEMHGNSGRISTPKECATQERLTRPLLRSLLASIGLIKKEWQVMMTPALQRLGRKQRKVIADILELMEGNEKKEKYLAVLDYENRLAYVFLRPGVDENDGGVLIESYLGALELIREAEEEMDGIKSRSKGIAKQMDSDLGPSSSHLNMPSGGWKEVLEAAGWSCERPALLQSNARLMWGEGAAVDISRKKRK